MLELSSILVCSLNAEVLRKARTVWRVRRLDGVMKRRIETCSTNVLAADLFGWVSRFRESLKHLLEVYDACEYHV